MRRTLIDDHLWTLKIQSRHHDSANVKVFSALQNIIGMFCLSCHLIGTWQMKNYMATASKMSSIMDIRCKILMCFVFNKIF